MNTKHLKAKILDLAIRGKLVSQDPSEGNAADLLKKIREEKSILIEQKKIKADKNSSFIIKAEDGRHYEQFADGSLIDIEDDIPFEIPENWCWCRLNDVCKEISDIDHRMPKSYHNGIPYISPQDFTKDGKINLKNAKKISPQDYEDLSEKSKPEKGDIIFPRYGTIGKIRCIDFEEPFLVSYSCATLKTNLENMNKNYVVYVLKSPLIQEIEIKKYINETTQANVGIQSIKNFLFPLPPLSEQKRIVSAIEKAFEQIDIIEKNKLNLKTYIKQTKSKVLDLAIHGKLVEQNPSEGNAFRLLEKIRNEKSELIKQKKIKEDKKSSFIFKAEDGKHYEHFADGSLKDIEDEIPFEIPENWCWCRLREIGIYKKGPFGSALTKAMFVSKSDSTIKVYEQQNAIKKNHELGHYYIKRDYFESDMKGFEVHPGDIIVSCAGTIGETYILPENIEKGIINQALMKMTITNELSVQFFLMYFDHILKTASADSGKGTAMKNIPPFDIFKQFLFPLPSLSEQERIVDKIEQIFEQLDILEKALGE